MPSILLFGGRSDERHVSVASAQNIVRALEGSSPLCWFWAPNGAIHDVGIPELLAHTRPFEIDYVPSRPAIWPDLEQALDTLPVDDPVFVLALHGGEGEDGTVQRMLESRRLPFTGSGSAASSAAFDKVRAKDSVRDRVPVAEARTASSASELHEAVDDLLSRHAKVVLKPVAGGSSRGLFFLDRDDDRDAVVNEAAMFDAPYLVEEFIAGREITVGVIDRGNGPLALPCIEIVVDPGHAFDYAGKYLGKGTREICPADVPPPLAAECQRVALEAHLALACDGYSRTDLVASDDGVWFLELNTLPGLTTSSLVPQQLAAAGIEFRTFLEEQLALARRGERHRG
jgi:D-alanine-D-alanine ligase